MQRRNMGFSFQSVTLEGKAPDREGKLVFRDGRLLALLTCLGDIHGDLAGNWFVEATFGDVPAGQFPVFKTTDEFEAWLAQFD